MILRIALVCLLASTTFAAPSPQKLAPHSALNRCLRVPHGGKRWSDPASWPAGVPVDGDCVTIPAGTSMFLDASTARLGGLSIEGELTFLCGDFTLTADWIHVLGKLEVGSNSHRFHRKGTIRLRRDFSCTSPIVSHHPNPGTVVRAPVLAVEAGGLLRLVGVDMGESWTRLGATASAGQDTLQLQTAPGWKAGQRIVVASTDFDMNQAEECVIQSVTDTRVIVARPLNNTHWGATEGQSFDGVGVEERAEVALLDRRIIVEGQEDGGIHAGHVIFLKPSPAGTPRGELESVELRYLGNEGDLGRYPLHFHHVGDATGSYVRNCSIHESYNRALSMHMTQNVEVTGNLSYDCLGHAFYFEDDSVRGCVMSGNLGLLTKVGTTIESDARPATFWLHNPNNIIEDNAAAGSLGDGFWFETEHWDTTPWTSFQGNVAHSNHRSGFMQDERRPAPVPPSVYADLTAYKNREFGLWLRTYGEAVVTNCKFADNRCAVYIASEGFQFDMFAYLFVGSASATGISKTWLLDSLFIGETANIGVPLNCWEQLAGRSLPQLWPVGSQVEPEWTALAGVEVYDGFLGIEDCTFAEYRDKLLTGGSCDLDRKAGALCQVFYYNPWAVDPRNYVDGLTFINQGATVTRPVFFRSLQGMVTPWWCTSPYSLDDGGLANVVLQDRDGSLGPLPGSNVYPVNPFLVPASGATLNTDWNAMVTSGPPAAPYAQLDFAQLHSMSGTSVTTWDGKPALFGAALHALTPDEWFVKGASIVDLCDAALERPIPRIVTNLPTDDIYEYHYDPALLANDWPVKFMISLQFTEPNRWVYVTIPLAAQPAANQVRVNGQQASMAVDGGTLYFGPGNEWWYDPAQQRLHLKMLTGGTGSTVNDGLRSTFVVNQ